MIKKYLLNIIEEIQKGSLNKEEGYEKIYSCMSGEMSFAHVDLARSERRGFAEVVYCKNKRDEDIFHIAKKLYEHKQPVLLTRANENVFNLISTEMEGSEYYKRSGVITLGQPEKKVGLVTVVSAGTSDIPVAEEASITAEMMGSNVQNFWDIGVAGIHRLFSKLDKIRESRVIIVAAGMDGALPGVVAGLVKCPVVAVPTAIGYGTGTGGFAALMTMLNSCAPGVTVVNIDNGFGAGYSAALINKRGE